MSANIKFVEANIVEQWLAEGTVTLVDVREPHERAQGYIKGSIANPLSSFDCAKVPVEPGKHLAFHCQMGRRCGPAAEKMAASGYQGDLFRLSGGFSAWVSQGKPVVR